MSTIPPQTPSPRPLGFRDFPAEIRLKIYGYLDLVKINQVAEYKGLLLCCHLIKEELEHEIVKETQTVIKSLQMEFTATQQLCTSTIEVPRTGHVKVTMTFIDGNSYGIWPESEEMKYLKSTRVLTSRISDLHPAVLEFQLRDTHQKLERPDPSLLSG